MYGSISRCIANLKVLSREFIFEHEFLVHEIDQVLLESDHRYNQHELIFEQDFPAYEIYELHTKIRLR